ncbi:hypothetical protein GX51_02650 [Blastomyces parvus]|uniref:Uncharacterized protein n=1 Tax=Blastomyces parvus TaxID=2060905 RepID=A0A2B7XAS7_9EURO|nr:hypothetical protein GX51_02650 [Blastomyces parvus]
MHFYTDSNRYQIRSVPPNLANQGLYADAGPWVKDSRGRFLGQQLNGYVLPQWPPVEIAM